MLKTVFFLYIFSKKTIDFFTYLNYNIKMRKVAVWHNFYAWKCFNLQIFL